MRALSQLVPTGVPHLRNTIYNPPQSGAIRVNWSIVIGLAHIAVAAGLRDSVAAKQDSWPLDETLFHCPGQPKVGATAIANGGKPPHEHAAQNMGGASGGITLWPALQLWKAAG